MLWEYDFQVQEVISKNLAVFLGKRGGCFPFDLGIFLREFLGVRVNYPLPRECYIHIVHLYAQGRLLHKMNKLIFTLSIELVLFHFRTP